MKGWKRYLMQIITKRYQGEYNNITHFKSESKNVAGDKKEYYYIIKKIGNGFE